MTNAPRFPVEWVSPRTWLIVLVSVMLAGCFGAAPKAPDPTLLELELSATQSLNLDSRGRSTPVVVRAYVLSSASAFETAEFFALFERDQAVLGASLMSSEEWTLAPGETRRIPVRDADRGAVLAVFAAFRDVDSAVWRATAPIQPQLTNRFVISVQDSSVAIFAKPPAPQQ